jgi:hypothetical protein
LVPDLMRCLLPLSRPFEDRVRVETFLRGAVGADSRAFRGYIVSTAQGRFRGNGCTAGVMSQSGLPRDASRSADNVR